MSSYVPPAEIALTYTCKDTFKARFTVDGKPNFNDVCLVSCHCRISLPPSTVPTVTS